MKLFLKGTISLEMVAQLVARNKMGLAKSANPFIFLVGRQGLEP
jgi:hypothetical protein